MPSTLGHAAPPQEIAAADSAPVSPAAMRRLQQKLLALEAERDAIVEELQTVQIQWAHSIKRWQHLFEALPSAAFVLDGLGMVLQANAQALAWLGRDVQPLGQELASLLQTAERSALHRAWLSSSQGNLGSQEASPPVVNGHSFKVLWLEDFLQASPAGVPKRRHESEVSFGQRLLLLERQVGPASRASHAALLQALLDSTGDVVYAVDTQGKLLCANSAVGRLLGRPQDSLVGLHREELLPAADALLHHTYDEQVLREGRAIELQEELVGNAQVGPRYFQTRKFPIKDASGHWLGVGGVSRDVTAAVERDRHRQLSELVFNQSSDALAVLDLDGAILRVNRRFEMFTGSSASSLQGHRLWIIQPVLNIEPPLDNFWSTVSQQHGWTGEITSRSLDGQPYTVRCSVTPLRDERERITGYAVVQSNLTQLRMAQAQVERLAAQDELTRLPNRRVMQDRLEQLILYSHRRKTSFGLLFADLDHFKEVNDTLGHHVGDQLLRLVADRLRAQLRSQDTVARNGGDEFVILLPDTSAEAATLVGQKLVAAVAEPINLPGLEDYRPSLTAGVATYPEDGAQGDVLLRHADAAMYAAKAAGRNRVMAFNRTMSQAAADFLDVQTCLPAAVQRGEMRLHFQPKFRLADRTVQGAEALVRWARPGLGLLTPKAFLGAAQRGGMLTMLDDWVLDEAIATAARWHAQGWLAPGWRLSVNQAAPDIRRPEWLTRLIERLEFHHLPPQFLEIELTEGLLAQPTPEVLANFSQLRAVGIHLSVDDFGTGYSSMAYLKSLPIAVMKIDGGFVRDMVTDPNDHSLVETMISLGRKLGHLTVAECIETEAQCQALAAMGCDLGQGYLFSPALPAAEFEARYLHQVNPAQPALAAFR